MITTLNRQSFSLLWLELLFERMRFFLSVKDRYEIRQTEMKPVLEAYLSWLHEAEPKVVKKSKLGQAIAYSSITYEIIRLNVN